MAINRLNTLYSLLYQRLQARLVKPGFIVTGNTLKGLYHTPDTVLAVFDNAVSGLHASIVCGLVGS